jgi:hypothetical protein
LGSPGGEHVRAAKGSYETDEREELCDYNDYIDASLTESGIDVEALAARQAIGCWGFTDEWHAGTRF